MKSNCRVFGQRDGAGIETLRLLFYICFSSIQGRSNKMTYFTENFKKQVFPMHAMKLHISLTMVIDASDWSSLNPDMGKSSRYPLNGKLDEPQS
jgi:hypothetical protein